MPSMDLIYRFLGVDAGAGAEFDRMSGKATVAGNTLRNLALGATVAAGTIAVVSVKMASDFQTSMTRLNTQANVSNKNVGILSKGVLAMAAAVGATPNQLAPAIYHIASIGQKSLTSAQELNILRIASEGAKLGGADLTDVTNALDAAIVSHIKGVKNYSQAMGVLNATVGAGDMTMQDLAQAFGPLGAVMKGYNVNIRQVGAALATFGDNNIRGAQAGTALRMSVQALAVPTVNGAKQLQAWGISSGSLAKQLEHGGLTSALDTLMQKMRANGVTAKDQGTILTEAFGKRAGVGLSVLMGELDRYHDKLHVVTDGANGFASSWKGYTKTFGYAWDSAKAATESMLIELGTKLLPVATKVTNWIAQDAIPGLSKMAGWLKTNVPQAIDTVVGKFEGMKSSSGGTISQIVNDARSGWQTLKTIFATGVDLVKAIWKDFGKTILSYLKGTFDGVLTVVKGAFKIVEGVFDIIDGVLTGKWSKIWTGIKDIFGGVWDVMLGTLKVMVTQFKTILGVGLDALKAVWHATWGLMERVFGDFSGAIITGLKWLTEAALAFMSGFINAASKAFGWVPFVGGKLKGAAKAFDDFSSGAITSLTNLANEAYGLGSKSGVNIGDGAAAGLRKSLPKVTGAAKAVAMAAITNLNKTVGAQSPAKKSIWTGQMIGDGLIVGMKSKTQPVKDAVKLLAEGLLGGWTGMADKLKNALTTPVQDALSKFQTGLTDALNKTETAFKTAQSKLKSLTSTIKSNITSLQSSLAGGVDLSSLFGTDANGNPTMGSVSDLFSGGAAQMTQFAADVKTALNMGLPSGMLTQIEGLGFAQGDQVLKQMIASGAVGIAGDAKNWNTIQAGAKSAATQAVMTPSEKKKLAQDQEAVKSAKEAVVEQKKTNRILEKLAAEGLGKNASFTIDGKTVHLKDEDAKEIVKILHKYEKQIGKKLLVS